MELTLFVDHQCNLRCSYCYNGDKFNRTMDLETMRAAVRIAARSPGNQLDVSFFGGEPLLRLPFLKQTVAHVSRVHSELPEPRPRLRFILNTNGTLIDDAAIELLCSQRFTVFVSIDGPRDVHDRCRVDAGGRGSFDKTLAGVDKLRQAKVPFQIMLVFGAETGARLGEGVRMLLPLGAEKIQLNANYRDDWSARAIAGLRRGLRAAGDAWIDWFRAGKALPVAPLHSKILSHIKAGLPCPSRCRLGGNELTVSPSGRIHPCPQMVGEDTGDELVIGHVRSGIDAGALALLERKKAQSLATCQRCGLFDRCQSQCGCRHVALTGQLGKITASLCETESAYIDAADRVAETLVAENCRTFIEYFYRRTWQPAEGAELVTLRRARQARA
jgi:uncharacterized protein